VFIVEPQWNPSVENQAIARALRLGQTQAVLVTRYVVDSTVEQVGKIAFYLVRPCFNHLRICENCKTPSLKCQIWSNDSTTGSIGQFTEILIQAHTNFLLPITYQHVLIFNSNTNAQANISLSTVHA
jgi:hypothetical protein